MNLLCIIIILYTRAHARRFDINYDDFNGSDAVQVKLLRALVSDINNVGSLSKSQITPDANKRITAVAHNFPWREVLFYGGVSDDVPSLRDFRKRRKIVE